MTGRVIDFEEICHQRLARRVHALGPRVLAEMLNELAGRYMLGTPVRQLLEQYSRLDPEGVRAVGADRFPPTLTTVQR